MTYVIFNFFQLSGKCPRAWARLEAADSAARATLTCRCVRLKSLSLIPFVIRLMGCSCHDSYIGTKANYKRLCAAGAWTSFDFALGDHLTRDGKNESAQADIIVPIIAFPLGAPSALMPPGLAASAGEGGSGDRRPSRQLWGPFYWFIIRTVIAKRNPWSHYLHRPLNQLNIRDFRQPTAPSFTP